MLDALPIQYYQIKITQKKIQSKSHTESEGCKECEDWYDHPVGLQFD